MAASVTLKGQVLSLAGTPLPVGATAPQVCLVRRDNQEVFAGGAMGKPQILITVPSLDTPVCATEAKKFNEALAQLSDKVLAVVISMDLPFAQNRYCDSYQVSGITIASDYRYRDMEKYGVMIAEGALRGILARAVFVIDGSGKITYTELVPEIAQEPNYEAALAAVRSLV
ncbi:MAG: thiol peroxidase [Bacteroidia bacterium]|nr:thiol peroxidase [Bacteroidia bacterium]MCX7652632.1 thiol peroxidase [Bacteroidia bacterium]MDW8417015.1 thiol peroxidase [Bacteroidia bacterium]